MSECAHDYQEVPGITGFTVGDWPSGLCEHFSIPGAYERCSRCGHQRLKPSVDEELKRADREAKAASVRCEPARWRNPSLLDLLKADRGRSLPKLGLWSRVRKLFKREKDDGRPS